MPAPGSRVADVAVRLPMRSLRLAPWLLLAAAMPALAQSGAPVDLSPLDDAMPGTPARLLVLGTVHLDQGAPQGYHPRSLEPLLQRLAVFDPQVVTIEAMPGETCDLMRRHRAVYADDGIDYCPDTEAARKATGLDVPAAIAAVEQALRAWPAAPAAAQRRRLAALFLASGEPASALVQWWQLPEAERRAGDGLDDTLVAQLRKREAANNENYQIAARVAARLGLQRVVPVDDHTGDNTRIDDEDAFVKAVGGAWEGARPQVAGIREREASLWASGDMLALYRHVNAPDTLRAAIAADFGAAMGEPSAHQYGRRYVAGWEARNLRMVANIRVAFRDLPGARVLSVVGASHKPWFDDLLGRMQGVELVDAERFLSAPPARQAR